MEITEEQLQQFISLYKQQFGITLASVEAQESFLSLLRLIALAVEPLELLLNDDNMNTPD